MIYAGFIYYNFIYSKNQKISLESTPAKAEVVTIFLSIIIPIRLTKTTKEIISTKSTKSRKIRIKNSFILQFFHRRVFSSQSCITERFRNLVLGLQALLRKTLKILAGKQVIDETVIDLRVLRVNNTLKRCGVLRSWCNLLKLTLQNWFSSNKFLLLLYRCIVRQFHSQAHQSACYCDVKRLLAGTALKRHVMV